MGFRNSWKTWLPLLALVVVGGLGVVGWWLPRVREERFQAALAESRRALEQGRVNRAREGLQALAASRPRHGEVLLLLGRCEEALGHIDQALRAWQDVPETDPAFGKAAESLGHVLINQGRYAPAESFLRDALGRVPGPGHERYPLLRTLARLLRLEGRFSEVSEALAAAWPGAPEPGALLEDLWNADTERVPAEAWKVFLDKADPQDDRVWLARARHALAMGSWSESDAWLARCRQRRPDDPAIDRASLDLAMAAGDLARFWAALERLPDGALPPRDLAAARAWVAGRSADSALERRELRRLAELPPTEPQTLERLAELALEAGDPQEAERLRQRKTEIDRARDQINKFIIRELSLRAHARELVELSRVLGRTFDENGWTLVVAGSTHVDPTLAKARAHCQSVAEAALRRVLAAPARGSRSLADQFVDLRGHARDDSSAPVSLAEANIPQFVDVAESAGLRFAYDNGHSPLWLLPESLSGGVGLVDVDGDGWLDVYCVQGGPILPVFPPDAPAPSSPGATEPADRLFRNQRDGTFRDITREAGVDRLVWGRGYGQGLAVGDFDNDGHADLFLTRLDRYILLRNKGDGSFDDVTERAGLAGARENPTSAAFADLDGDGDLDLYVCHYARWDPERPPSCKTPEGAPYYCDPALYERALDHVFRNDKGRFVDVTEAAGFTDPDGRGLGVVVSDLDGDGRIDVFVANDGTANYQFRNLGGFEFEEVGFTTGTAGNAEGAFRAGMGVAATDLDGDGRPDILVTNLEGQGTTLYRNLGQGVFADQSAASGILNATRYLTGFGIAVFDASNDGRPDVAIANGHVNDFRPYHAYAMPARLYQGAPGGKLVDVSDRAGPPWLVPRLGRGLAAGDLDNDGRMDLIIQAQDAPLAFLHNRTKSAGHFVTLRLEGRASNRDAIGARVTLTTSEGRQTLERVGGGGYLAAHDPRLHFGLGKASKVDILEVRWPSGHVDLWKDVTADQAHLLVEGATAPAPLPHIARPASR